MIGNLEKMKQKLIELLKMYVEADEGHTEEINMLAFEIVQAFVNNGWRYVEEARTE